MVNSKTNNSDMGDLAKISLSLQKLTISLVESNNALNKKIDKLVTLFEDAAKNMSAGSQEEVINLNKKVNELVEQNKQLARGLILMEGKVKSSEKPSFEAKSLPQI